MGGGGGKVAQNGGGGGGGLARSRPRSKQTPEEMDLLPEIYAGLDSGDWRERLAALEKGVRLVEDKGDMVVVTGKLAQLVNRLSERLSDRNLKVNILALEGVARITRALGPSLEPVLNTLIPLLCKNFASTNQQLVLLAGEAMDALSEEVDPCLLVQPVASLAEHGNPRLKV
ncbi:unnamed protein product, partial [Discosporangium mesarthrocarpum]